MSRDWMGTLWPASFRGVPFFVKSEGHEVGRRVVTHEFPMRDRPFNEDLGARAERFEVTAYLASDTADADAAVLKAAIATSGAGTLILPYQGSVSARGLSCKTTGERDELGYVLATLTFVLEGDAASPISLNSLAAGIFAATSALGAIAEGIMAAIAVTSLGGQVTANAIATFQTAVASFEVIREGFATDPTQSTLSAATLATLYAAAPTGISRLTGVDVTLGAQLVDAARDLGDAMPAATAVSEFGSLLDAPPVDPGPETPPVAIMAYTPGLATSANRAIAANAARLSRVARLAAIAAYCEAVVNQTYASRQDGIAARALLAERFDIALAEAVGVESAPLFSALVDLQGQTVEWLSQIIATLAPVVTVSANQRMPSVWWAWRLYADPTRDAELVARNGVKHPGFMPVQFEALSA